MIIVPGFPFYYSKKNPRRLSHSHPVKLSGEQINPTASSRVHPPRPAQTGARKYEGKRGKVGKLSGAVNHRELLCLQLPCLGELKQGLCYGAAPHLPYLQPVMDGGSRGQQTLGAQPWNTLSKMAKGHVLH